MLIPSSLDFGSCQFNVTYHNRSWKIKIYPRLVHVIKSFNSRLSGTKVKTKAGLVVRGNITIEMIQKLSSIYESRLGGFRIEVSVNAPTLQEAKRLVKATPFLRPSTWLHPTEPALQDFGVDIKLVSKEGLLGNANWLYQQAVLLGTFKGDKNKKPSGMHSQASTDIMAGFGWNAGQRHPTKSQSTTAWWRKVEVDTQEILGTLASLNKIYPTDLRKLDLFKKFRQACGHVPCQREPKIPSHRYWVKSREPVRWECCVCKHNMVVGQGMRWFAKLVDEGYISRERVGLEAYGGSNGVRAVVTEPFNGLARPIIDLSEESPVEEEEQVSTVCPEKERY
jgi:hypothetical protein